MIEKGFFVRVVVWKGLFDPEEFLPGVGFYAAAVVIGAVFFGASAATAAASASLFAALAGAEEWGAIGGIVSAAA